MKRETILSGLVLAFSLGAFTGQSYAQEAAQKNIRTLDKTFRTVAKSSIPKTVLVKSYVGAGNARAGYGTGAVISEDGYILTCSHVIDIASRVEVQFADKTIYAAKVMGKNKRQDYALLKITPKAKLKTFKVGNSSKVKLGQWVVALGHPGGPYADRQPAFSAGRVTGLHRKLPVQFMERYYNDAIQTDCPIYAGNSGGPLINLKGELIGLNGAILMINDNAYAVPINQVMNKIKDLKAGNDIEGERAGPEAFAELQKHMKPEDMEKMQKRMFENFGKMFGGKDGKNPLGDLFGGKDGKNPLGDLFGGKGGQGLDLNKLFEEFGKMFGGDNKGPNGGPGQGQGPGGMDLGKLFEEFGKMFGGDKKGPGQGQGPGGMDLGKLFEEFGKMFGGQQPGPNKPQQRPQPRKKVVPAARRGYLGVVPSSDSDNQNLGGVVIAQVVKNGPAAKADLRKGDIITAVNGRATPDIDALKGALSGSEAGDQIVVSVTRSRLLDSTWVKSKLKLKVTLGQSR